MNPEVTSVPVPAALRELIRSNNQLLQSYQKELTAAITDANTEMMLILGLSPQEGWRLNTDTMEYVLHRDVQKNETVGD